MDARDITEIETVIRRTMAEALPEEELKLLAQQQGQILEMVKKHDITLYGNGKPGLASIVQVDHEFIKSLQDTLTGLARALVLILVVALIVLAVQHGLVK